MYNEQLRGPYFLMHGVAMLISLEGGGRVGSIAASMCIISRKTCIFFPLVFWSFVLFFFFIIFYLLSFWFSVEGILFLKVAWLIS